jgi:hypothetical protein
MANAGYIEGNTANVVSFEPLHGAHPQARFSHLTRVEYVAKFSKLEGSVEVSVCFTENLAWSSGTEAATNLVVVGGGSHGWLGGGRREGRGRKEEEGNACFVHVNMLIEGLSRKLICAEKCTPSEYVTKFSAAPKAS